MRASYKLLAVSVTTALFGAVQVSMAQESSTEMRTDSSGVLEEIIITATKVESSIQDTPIAVSAFSQDQLDSQLINDTMNLQFNVPNMTMSKQNFTANDIRIRGIGSGAIGPAGDTGVGIHINGMYQTSSRIFEAQFYDTERVEVLRGPQGTLYGRNTTGGVVNVITAKADPGELSGKIDGTLGNYNFAQLRGMVNVPLGDTFALRASAMSLSRDGFIDNVFDGEDVDDRDMWAGRLSLTWNATKIQKLISCTATLKRTTIAFVPRSKPGARPSGILGCRREALVPEHQLSGGITGALISSISGLNASRRVI